MCPACINDRFTTHPSTTSSNFSQRCSVHDTHNYSPCPRFPYPWYGSINKRWWNSRMSVSCDEVSSWYTHLKPSLPPSLLDAEITSPGAHSTTNANKAMFQHFEDNVYGYWISMQYQNMHIPGRHCSIGDLLLAHPIYCSFSQGEMSCEIWNINGIDGIILFNPIQHMK